jgi:hypothetical protein
MHGTGCWNKIKKYIILCLCNCVSITVRDIRPTATLALTLGLLPPWHWLSCQIFLYPTQNRSSRCSDCTTRTATGPPCNLDSPVPHRSCFLLHSSGLCNYLPVFCTPLEPTEARLLSAGYIITTRGEGGGVTCYWNWLNTASVWNKGTEILYGRQKTQQVRPSHEASVKFSYL